MPRICAAFVLLVALPMRLDAQAARAEPRAGAWGAEAIINGNTFGGALLRFRSERAAWRFGLSAQFTQVERQVNLGGDQIFADDRTMVTTAAEVGIRSFLPSHLPIRPTFGGGISSSVSQTSGQQRVWRVGAFGDVGAYRSFGEGFKLGVTTGIALSRTEQKVQDDKLTGLRFDLLPFRLSAVFAF